jgi:large subunit ribosomal protein L13
MSLYPALKNPAVRAPKWWLVDAQGHHVGRLASQLPKLLTGKYKPSWAPAVDCGDYVVIINAKHVKFTGKKWDQKYYKWHTGWVGGLKQRSASVMLEKKPEEIMRKAVTRMMKKTALRARYERRLLIYPGEVHPHADQAMEEFNPISSTSPVSIPRFSHSLNTDHSLRLTKDADSNDWTISARVFKGSAHPRTKAAAKRDGWYGKGHTVSPQDSMYPDTFMLGPALTHSEWKRVREMVKTDSKPENWPIRESSEAIDQYVKASIQKQLANVKHILANPTPKAEVTNPYISTTEAQELMKNAPKAAPSKKK